MLSLSQWLRLLENFKGHAYQPGSPLDAEMLNLNLSSVDDSWGGRVVLAKACFSFACKYAHLP